MSRDRSQIAVSNALAIDQSAHRVRNSKHQNLRSAPAHVPDSLISSSLGDFPGIFETS